MHEKHESTETEAKHQIKFKLKPRFPKDSLLSSRRPLECRKHNAYTQPVFKFNRWGMQFSEHLFQFSMSSLSLDASPSSPAAAAQSSYSNFTFSASGNSSSSFDDFSLNYEQQIPNVFEDQGERKGESQISSSAAAPAVSMLHFAPAPAAAAAAPTPATATTHGVPPHQLSWMKRMQSAWLKGTHDSIRVEPPALERISFNLTALDFCLKPVIFWAPVKFWKDIVPFAPCPVSDCSHKTTGNGWATMPRVLQEFNDISYIWSSAHVCPVHKHFLATDYSSIAKLPHLVQMQATFLTTERGAASQQCEILLRFLLIRLHAGS